MNALRILKENGAVIYPPWGLEQTYETNRRNGEIFHFEKIKKYFLSKINFYHEKTRIISSLSK